MRKLVVLLALGALAVPAALAQSTFPEKIALPNAFAPEGIEVGLGNTFYVGSRTTGAVYTGNLRTGAGRILVQGDTATPSTRGATGIEYDRGRLWVAGAGFGNARIYNARTGTLLREYQFATPPGTFINDIALTKRAAFFTDSNRPVLYRVAVARNGAPGAMSTIPLTGEYQHVAGFNLNGIVATPSGKMLIAVSSAARKLYSINPAGVAKTIDIGSYNLENGDGLLLHGRTLYVVQNRSNVVAVFQLSTDLTKATFVRTITDGDFDIPTTIDRAGERLYVVNARFTTTTPTDQSYHVVKAG
jgi:sugar lactone lactonase YvrE